MWRFAIVFVIIACCFVAVAIKIFYIQTVQYDELMSMNPQKTEVLIPAKRGNIYSSDGQLMASTVPTYKLYMDTQTEYLRKNHGKRLKENVDSLAWYMAHKFGGSPSVYKQRIMRGYVQKNRRLPLYSGEVSYNDLKEIKQFPLFRLGKFKGGLIADERTKRMKPYGSMASRTIGDIYGDASRGGRSGLEYSFNSALSGTPGIGVKTSSGILPIEAAVDGLDITTTIDIEMQDIAESIFRKAVENATPQSGCVALMDVHTGELKACVNLVRGQDGNYDESNDILFTSKPEPGSVFKVMSMMVALENGVVKADDKIETGDGVWKMHGRNMTDTHKNGTLTMTEVIAKSSNIGMSRVIDEYYYDKPGDFVDELYKMGVGKEMKLDYPGAAKPNVRHPKDKNVKWSGTTLAWMSIGYEVEMPPIYTLAFYNAIANDGKLIKPFLVKSINKNGRVLERFKTETINSKICSNSTLNKIRPMLRAVVTDGTAQSARSKYVALAGKTGTAQVGYGKNGPRGHLVTFCGYFPAEKPLYSIIVVMREPAYPADAGFRCGPVARDIAERIIAQKVRLGLPENEVVGDMPIVKSGQTEAVRETLDELDFDFENVKSPWASAQWNDEFVLKGIDIRNGLVPNVVGMGANDAAYLMEKAGLHVQLYGTGRVQKQSITAGTVTQRGATVTLELR